MGRASGLTGRRAGVVAVDPVLVPVIRAPLFRAPLDFIRQLLSGIGHRATVLGAQLLTQLHRTGGAILHTTTAGHTLRLVHLGNVRRAGHIGRIKQLRSPQGIANIHIAVADGKDFVLTVNVGDLVHKAVVLGTLQDLQHLIVGHIMAFVGLYQIVRHIAYADAPVLGIIAAALAQFGAAHTAGAGTGGILALIFLQPVGNMLHIDRLIFRLNGLFHRNHMHTDTGTAGGHHGGDLLQR